LLLSATDQSLENLMNEEAFTLSMRKFLKMVGVSSQTAIENAVAQAVADKSIGGTESFPATMTLEIAGLKLKTTFNGNITLE
jgi:D-alanyl-D-alanine carboxypeptidase